MASTEYQNYEIEVIVKAMLKNGSQLTTKQNIQVTIKGSLHRYCGTGNSAFGHIQFGMKSLFRQVHFLLCLASSKPQQPKVWEDFWSLCDPLSFHILPGYAKPR